MGVYLSGPNALLSEGPVSNIEHGGRGGTSLMIEMGVYLSMTGTTIHPQGGHIQDNCFQQRLSQQTFPCENSWTQRDAVRKHTARCQWHQAREETIRAPVVARRGPDLARPPCFKWTPNPQQAPNARHVGCMPYVSRRLKSPNAAGPTSPSFRALPG